MSQGLKDYIKRIKEENTKFGGLMQSPASEHDIDNLRLKLASLNEYEAFIIYEQILRLVNGIDYNGYTLYGTHNQLINGFTDRTIEGFIEANLLWATYGDNKDHHYIMYGETGMSLYVHNRSANQFEVIDRVSSDAYYEFQTLEQLLEKLFRDMLEMYDE